MIGIKNTAKSMKYNSDQFAEGVRFNHYGNDKEKV